MTNLIATGGSAYSVLLVAKQGSGALFTLRRSTTYSASKFHQLTNTYVHGDGVNTTSNVTTTANTSATTNSASVAFKSCHKYLGAGVNPAIYLNGAGPLSVSTGTSQTTETGSSTGFQVGTDAATEPWGGLIAEVIVTANAIADTDRIRVEGYQRDFFGV